MSGQPPINTGVTVGIVMVVVICTVIFMIWVFRKNRHLCNGRSILRRSDSIRLPDPMDSTVLTLSDAYDHRSTSLPKQRLEWSKCPGSHSRTGFVNCEHTSGIAIDTSSIRRLQCHPFPQHCTNGDRFFVEDGESSDPRNITLQLSDVSYKGVETGMLLRTILPNGIPQIVGKFEEIPVISPRERVPPGMETCKLQVKADAPTERHAGDAAKRIMLESQGLDSGISVMGRDSDSISMDTVRASWVHSSNLSSSTAASELTNPKLSSTPISLKDDQIVERGMVLIKAQVTTPPNTPTTDTVCSLTTTSHYNLHPTILNNLNKDLAEDIMTWSDVLSVAEYEREEHLIHARKAFSFQTQLPSPPSTPTMVFTPPSPTSLSSSSAIQEAQWLSARSTSYFPLERTSNEKNVDVRSTADRHQPSGDDHSFARAQETAETPRCGLPMDIDARDEDNHYNELPPYQRFGFDYETLLALKRTTSLLAKPIRPKASSTRIVLRQAASAIRPRPPIVEYKPLLLRPVDRSKIKQRTGFLGIDGTLAAIKKSTIQKTTRQRKGSRITGELSPHVQVLELLIEHVSERRTGDIALGTV